MAAARLEQRARRSDEGPALHDLDDEVLARRQRLVAVRLAALCAAQVQVAVQPQPELATVTEFITSVPAHSNRLFTLLMNTYSLESIIIIL